MSATESEWLTRKEAARYLGTLGYSLSPAYLSNLASNNNARKGPPFSRFGWNTVRYQRDDLRTWLEARVTRVA